MVPSDAPKADVAEYPPLHWRKRVEKINFSIREEEMDRLVRDARQITTPGVKVSVRLRLASGSNGPEVDRQSCLMKKLWRP